MHICMLVFNQTNKGTYRRANQLAKGLVKKGHDVALISTSPTKKFIPVIRKADGVVYFESPDLFSGALRSGWDLWNTALRVHWAKAQNFDIVHSFESRPVCIYPALAIRKHKRIPIVLDWADWLGTGGSIEERKNPLVRFFLRPFEDYYESHFRSKVEGATVINSLLYKKAIQAGVPKEKILQLPNGSDTSGILQLDKTEARNVLGLKQNTFIIGHIGTIFENDGKLMTAAFEAVLNRIPNTLLLLIGKSPFDVKKFSKHNNSIIQTGWVEESMLNYWLSAMDIGWLPMVDSNANRGRFPLKFHDYMAAGKPIVSTNVGDICQLMEDHSFGRVVEPVPQALAEATINLHDNPDVLSRMGDEARLMAETRFSWKNIVDCLESYYGTLIG